MFGAGDYGGEAIEDIETAGVAEVEHMQGYRSVSSQLAAWAVL